MILENFGIGWQEQFEELIAKIIGLYPNTEIKTLYRRSGMLHIVLTNPDPLFNFILKGITRTMETTSSTVCETCGKYGRRIKDDPRLPEINCYCWKCYALALDAWEQRNADVLNSSEET